MSEPAAIELDLRGQRCPAPVIALGRQSTLTPGVCVDVLADDPAAQFDIPAWCRMRAAVLVSCLDESADDTTWQRYTVVLPAAN